MDQTYLRNYVTKMEQVLAKRTEIEAIVDSIVDNGFRNLFFCGIGGTLAVMLPYQHMITKLSTLDVYGENAAVLTSRGNHHLGVGSVVLSMSESGNTKEIVEALAYCKEQGAVTITFVATEDSPVGNMADYTVINKNKDQYSNDSDYLMLNRFVFYLLSRRGEFGGYERFIKNMHKMPRCLAGVKEQADRQGIDFAKTYKDEGYHIFTAGGNVWGETFCYAMCVLEEMQWVRTKSVHICDFFHGTLELVDNNTHVVLVKGEDESRPYAERVQRFTEKYTKKLTVYDSRDYDLPGIDEDFRWIFSPLVITAALGRISPHMEEMTGHDLNFRRYYKVVDY